MDEKTRTTLGIFLISMGIALPWIVSKGPVNGIELRAIGDVNNDGYQDFYYRNNSKHHNSPNYDRIFLGQKDGTYMTVEQSDKLQQMQARELYNSVREK